MSDGTPVGYQSYHDAPSYPTATAAASAASANGGQEENGVTQYNDLNDTNAAVGSVAAAICVAGFLVSVFFVVLEQNNRYIRFHAYQSMLVNVIFFFIFLVLIIGMLADAARGWLWSFYVFFLLQLAVGTFMAAHAYRGARTGRLYSLPFAGPAALTFALNAPAPANLNPKIQML